MKIFGKEITVNSLYDGGLSAIVIADLFLITVSLIFQIPSDVSTKILHFDLVVCIILLAEYFINLARASSKRDYILDKENLIGLIASIPLDFILPFIFPINVPVSFLRYLRIFRLLRVFNLTKFKFINDLFRKTGLHKVIITIVVAIVIFWGVFYLFSPSYDCFDDFYFVIVTLTTVGYGDITPSTYNEKVVAIILIIFGVIGVSTFTGVISSFLTDRILDDEEEDKNELRQTIEEKSENILKELENVRMENRMLRDETDELKSELKELKSMIEKK